MVRIAALAVAAALLALPAAALTKGPSMAPGQTETTPVQMQTAPGGGKGMAPGQVQKKKGGAKYYAPRARQKKIK